MITAQTTQPETGIMPRLREATWDLHQAAEKSPLMQSMVRGTLPLERYAAWLGQMYLLHLALEGALQRVRAGNDAVRSVVHDWQFQLARIEADLGFFERASGDEPMPSIREFTDHVARIAEAEPVALLGAWYVLEGSKNGGTFIAKAVRRTYNLEGQNGVRHLDPYGESQRERWAEFKSAMSAQHFTERETVAMIEEARAMFRTVTRIGDELSAPAPATR